MAAEHRYRVVHHLPGNRGTTLTDVIHARSPEHARSIVRGSFYGVRKDRVIIQTEEMQHYGLMFGSTKRYSPGFSCAFAQWQADSHCKYLHGYALEFEFTFEAEELDARNWVVDFGALKPVKSWLESMYDHTTLVARDNPNLDYYRALDGRGQLQLREVDATGCEATALEVFRYTELWLLGSGFGPRCRVVKVEVREHTGNSAYVRIA